MVGQYSSMAQDLARGRPSEIDHLNGYVVRRGEALGVATPVNRVLQTLVKLLDTKAKAAGPLATASSGTSGKTKSIPEPVPMSLILNSIDEPHRRRKGA